MSRADTADQRKAVKARGRKGGLVFGWILKKHAKGFQSISDLRLGFERKADGV